MIAPPDAREIVALALAEDLGVPAAVLRHPAHSPDPSLLERDVTSASIIPVGAVFEGRIVARQECVVCGLPVADEVWRTLARAAGLDPEQAVDVFPLVAEGAKVSAGTAVAEVSGMARLVLAGERSALNFVMVLSGIATQAARWQAEAGPGLAVCDTRKTASGLRALSKYAVAVGGGTNHRQGLWDMVLVKDNHVAAAGGISAAIASARSASLGLLLEVEADTLAAALEAAEAGADIVLLDNMDDELLGRAVATVQDAARRMGRAIQTEASGGITYERLASLRATGVDRVSSSALTLAPALDFGLDEVR